MKGRKMKPVKNFQEIYVVCGRSPHELVENCNEILRGGDWTLHGSVNLIENEKKYIQYMVRTITIPAKFI